MKNKINYFSPDNNVKVVSCSSQWKGSPVENVLNADDKSIWLSDKGFPQFITIDYSKMKERPKCLKCLGIYCWHAYPTNPKLIELLVSKDNSNFHSLGNFDFLLKPGTQYLTLEDDDVLNYNFLKIILKETHGGDRVYINNIYFYEDYESLQDQEEFILSDNRERNLPRKSETHLKVDKELSKKNETNNDDVYLFSDSDLSSYGDRFKKKKISVTTKSIISEKMSKDYIEEKSSDKGLYNKSKTNSVIEKIDDNISLNISNKSNSIKPSNQYTQLEDKIIEMQNQIYQLTFDSNKQNDIETVNKNKNVKLNPLYTEDDLYQFLKLQNLNDIPSVSSTPKIQAPNRHINITNEYTYSPREQNDLDFYLKDEAKNPVQSDEKILHLENKINTFENDLYQIKQQMQKLTDSIGHITETKNLLNKNNMGFVLDECRKMINKNISSDKKIKKSKSKINYDKLLNKKIEEQFESFIKKIENNLRESIIEPSVKKLEKNMKSGLSEIQEYLKHLERKRKDKKSNPDEVIKIIKQLADKLDKKEKLLIKLDKQTNRPVINPESEYLSDFDN